MNSASTNVPPIESNVAYTLRHEYWWQSQASTRFAEWHSTRRRSGSTWERMDAGDNDNNNSSQESEVRVAHKEDDDSSTPRGNDANINNANMNDVFALDLADDEDPVGQWGRP